MRNSIHHKTKQSSVHCGGDSTNNIFLCFQIDIKTIQKNDDVKNDESHGLYASKLNLKDNFINFYGNRKLKDSFPSSEFPCIYRKSIVDVLLVLHGFAYL